MKYFLPGYLRLVVVSLIVFAINVVIFATGWFLNSLNILPELLVNLYSNPIIFWVLYIILFYSILHIDTKEKERSNLENLQQEVGGLKNTEQIPKTPGKFNLDNLLKISLVAFVTLLISVVIFFFLFVGRENMPEYWNYLWLVIFYGFFIFLCLSVALLVIKLFRSGQKGTTIAVLTITSLIILAIVVTYLQFYERDDATINYQATQEASSSAKLAVQDKTADWKTFESTVFQDFTYSIKYPDQIKVLLSGPEGSGAVFSNLAEDEDIIWITYNNLPSEQTYKTYADAATAPGYGNGKELIKQTTKIVDGETMYINQIKMPDDSIHLQALIAEPRVTTREGAVYNITNLNLNVINAEEFDLMLSTFKFI